MWCGCAALSDAARATILATMLTVGGTVSLGIYAHHRTRQKEIEQALYAKKQPVYESLITFIFGLMDTARRGEAITEAEMREFIITHSKDMMLWGSDEVVVAYLAFRNGAPLAEEQPAEILLALENLLRAI